MQTHMRVYMKITFKGKQLTGLLQLTGVSIWKGYDLEGILCWQISQPLDVLALQA